MSRIAPLAAALCAGNPGAVRPHHARRVAARFVSRRGRQRPRLGKIPRRQPAGSRAALVREREIVIDRTCALTGANMNGASMSRHSRRPAHLTDEQVRATVRSGADAPCWSPAEQAMIAAVDALHHRATLSDAEFAALRAHYDDAKILEIILLCGFYHTVSYLATGWHCRWRRTARGFRSRRHSGARARTNSASIAT